MQWVVILFEVFYQRQGWEIRKLIKENKSPALTMKPEPDLINDTLVGSIPFLFSFYDNIFHQVEQFLSHIYILIAVNCEERNTRM